MKDFLIKSAILFLVALFESAVGLPILLSGLFLFWIGFASERYQISWVVYSGVLLGLLWNLVWWLSVLLMFLLALVFLGSREVLPNKNLRIVFLVVLLSGGVFFIKGFNFSFRFLIYPALSGAILIFLQRFLVEKFEKKYL